MVNSIIVTNYLGESIVLELGKPEESGFLITSIDGLGPGKANINTTNKSGMDGSKYNSAKRENRNIVIHLKFVSDGTESIEDIRQKSYKFFPIKKNVQIIVVTDNRVCATDGYVESNEPSIFEQQEGCDISVICTDPDLYDALRGWNVDVLSGLESLFEFPFSNESLTDNIIEMSNVNTTKEKNIYYDGDIESGLIIRIKANGTAENITIFNLDTRESFIIDTDRLKKMNVNGIIEGDEIEISTNNGNKYIRFIRDGIESSILNCIDIRSDWFKLRKGYNRFSYSCDFGDSNLDIQLEHRVLYEGV